MISRIRVSSPGRICLFGEHQDYLGLPVVAAAVNLRITIKGRRTDRREIRLTLPDTLEKIIISLDEPIEYQGPRDYIRSVFKVLRDEKFTFNSGWDATLVGEIPIGKGCSSSSAMAVAWTAFLILASDRPQIVTTDRIAILANRAEVLEFGEPGGIMDHVSSAVGGMVFVNPKGDCSIRSIATKLKCAFVLGDSLQPKATTEVLGRVKSTVLDGLERLRKEIPGFSIETVSAEDARKALKSAPAAVRRAVLGNIRNRDITRLGLEFLESDAPDAESIGALLTEQHSILRGALGISTPRVEALVDAALSAGAIGAKINGSGGGGCMYAMCAPRRAATVAEAIRDAGGEPRVLRIDSGVRRERS